MDPQQKDDPQQNSRIGLDEIGNFPENGTPSLWGLLGVQHKKLLKRFMCFLCPLSDWLWRAGTTPNFDEKKCSENLGWNFGVQSIQRVAPRVAPRIGFSHKLGRECHSENCSENAPEFRQLLREWPFHSESVFSKLGWFPGF